MGFSLQVTLQYKLHRDLSSKEMPISTTSYFDPDYVSCEEALDIDDVPLHDHAIDYLNLDPSLVEYTRLTVRDTLTAKERVINETFWNNGNNRVIERRDHYRGKEDYWEMIIDTQLTAKPLTLEIIRIGKKGGILVPFSHVLIKTAEDGSQSELKIYPPEQDGNAGDKG